MAEIPRTTLNNAVKIPQLGFGTYQVPPQQTAEVVTVALHTGYRHVDTAALYANEREVGQAIARSGLPRREVFVTTKLGNPNHGYDSALRAFDRSLRLLDLEVLDLYLIHWPQPRRDRYVETWRALEKLYADGRVRAIGVSNFQVGHLERLLAETDVVPAVNQVELSPYITQEPLRRFHQQHGIATESWSPLARGGRLLREPLLVSLAKKYGKSPAQVVLRWHIQNDLIVIPKSVTPARIAENIAAFDFELVVEDMAAINGLNRDRRIGPNPGRVG